MKILAIRTMVLSSIVGAVLFAACGSDKTTVEPARLSGRGESCRASGDCAAGLVCVGSVCSVGSLQIMPTGKQCVLVACHEPKDCCPIPPTNCASLQQACEAGFTVDCQQYQALCMCDGSKFTCDSGKCSQVCTPSDGVTIDSCKVMGQGFSCVNGKCVECMQDTDCPMVGSVTRVCKDNKCQIKCTKDLDCDPFYTCDMGTSTCVYSGCKTNLECISKTGNALAVCMDTKCDVPCQSDPECTRTAIPQPVPQPGAVMLGLQVCVSSHCVDVGCDTDDQCRILNRITGGSRTTAECQPIPQP
jgi:hypothetical protein